MFTRPCLAVLSAILLAAGSSPPAEAGTKDEVFTLCADGLKKEFGAAPFKFDKLRRDEDNNRQRAFGQLTLKNGKTATIRCRVRGGKVFDVKFSTGVSNSLGGSMWDATRPPGAEYIPFEDEVPDEDRAAEDPAEEQTASTDPEQTPDPAQTDPDAAPTQTDQAGSGQQETTAEAEQPQRSNHFKEAPTQ